MGLTLKTHTVFFELFDYSALYRLACSEGRMPMVRRKAEVKAEML